MSLLTLHTVVRNLHTGDEGIICALDGDIAMVEMSDGDRYPIPLQSLVRTEAFFGTIAFDKDLSDKFGKKPKSLQKRIEKQEFQATHPNQTPPKPFKVTHESPPLGTPANTGLHLGFDLAEGIYLVYLINDSNCSFTVSVSLRLNDGEERIDFKHTIIAYQFFPIGELMHSDLNRSPKIELSAPSICLTQSHALRPNFFYKEPQTLDICPKPLLIWTVKQRLTLQDAPDALKNRAQDKVAHKPPKQPLKPLALVVAEFETVLDLHENVLLKNKKYAVADILRLQLSAFEAYLQRAIMLNIPRVYIIHGAGTGKLRAEIWKILKKNAQIIRFNDDYNPKFGHGATEIVIND